MIAVMTQYMYFMGNGDPIKLSMAVEVIGKSVYRKEQFNVIQCNRVLSILLWSKTLAAAALSKSGFINWVDTVNKCF